MIADSMQTMIPKMIPITIGAELLFSTGETDGVVALAVGDTVTVGVGIAALIVELGVNEMVGVGGIGVTVAVGVAVIFGTVK